MSRFLSLVFAALTLGCAGALADESQAQDSDLQRSRATYRDQDASLGYTILDGEERIEVTVYVLADLSRPLPGGRYGHQFVVQREHDDETKWTDGTACPALFNVLGWLERLTPPRIDAPGLRLSPLDGYVFAPSNLPAPHAPTLVVWGSGYDAGSYPVSVTFAGRGELMLNFARNSEAALQDCWQSEPPAPPV